MTNTEPSNKRPAPTVVAILAAGVILAVLLLSYAARQVAAEKPEGIPALGELTITADMTLAQVAKTNQLPPQLVAKALAVEPADSQAQTAGQSLTVAGQGFTVEEARAAIIQTHALMMERQTKDFTKIFIKFGLWIVLLIIPLALLARPRLTRAWRLTLLSGGVVVFGVILGSDPSPMGTVKDMIALAGEHHVLFIPRLIALGVFLALVVFANKFICSWGCQFGVLQELLYRLNRQGQKRYGVIPLIRIPYAVSNTIRIVFFVVFTLVAFGWAFDLIGPIDPFKTYNPAAMTTAGMVFVVLLLIFSVVVYRPWCHLFCPFGLVSWLFERLSFVKVRVDYDKCIACKACMNDCPSEAMQGILLGHKLPSDCFSCGDCLSACPTQAVRFAGPGAVRPGKSMAEKLKKLRGRA
ncbi:4Fe-4S binding protein [bacterium]|nr:4Fe-4S binding protein [bacterium]